MKAILFLAALHMLIIYQSQKKHSNDKNVLPEPASTPATPAAKQPTLGKMIYPGFISAFYYGKSYHPVTISVPKF